MTPPKKRDKVKVKKVKACRHKWEQTGDNDCVFCGYIDFFTCEKCGAEKDSESRKIYR